MMPGKYLIVGMLKIAAAQRERLYALGMMPGCSVRIITVSPYGGPLVVELNGARWSLERSLWNSLDTVAMKSP